MAMPTFNSRSDIEALLDEDTRRLTAHAKILKQFLIRMVVAKGDKAIDPESVPSIVPSLRITALEADREAPVTCPSAHYVVPASSL
jgi:hypothetical protein